MGAGDVCNVNFTENEAGDMCHFWKNETLPCVSSYKCAELITRNCTTDVQFCDDFKRILPYIYMAFSCFSALCCVVVFITYFGLPRLRRTGYSSKVFLNRTLMDFVIAVGHIVAGAAGLPGSDPDDPRGRACMALGIVNEFALVASNLWYVFLAIDLIRAIRNPFSSQPSYTCLYNFVVLFFSSLLAGILVILIAVHGPEDGPGPGTSMFFFCWVKVEHGSQNGFLGFFFITFSLYYFWHILFWIFSLTVIVVAGGILWGHLPASSETRKFVLKQNLVYVLVLGLETLFIVTFWLTQFALVNKKFHKAYFFTKIDLGLAIVFAIIHSLRGAVDLFVWRLTFSIGRDDIKLCLRRSKIKFSTQRGQYIPQPTLTDCLITTDSVKDNLINKALRRNAIYCINVGILDAVQLDLDQARRTRRVGSVRDAFAAAALLEMDQENQRDEIALLHKNPTYREQVVRKIRFPSSSTHIKEFSFIDLEPTVFSLLRESYGISPRTYRKSFEIKNASDIDSVKFIEKSTEGKSGSFFYFTPDNCFIIKNVTAAEEKFLCKIAYEYYEHMKENRDSLIVRLFGLHKVRLAPEQRYITVVVMENIFYSPRQRKIHRRFDLKGSWIGRRSLKAGQRPDEYKGTLKDLDLGEEKIFIGSDQKEQLMEILRRDVAFLTKCRIMDYSLLLGILQDSGNAVADSSCSSRFSDFPSMTHTVSTVLEEPTGTNNARDLTLSNRRDTALSEDLYIPWYRQDSGGLHSVCSYQQDFEQSLPVNSRDSMVKVGNPPVTYFFGIVDILQEYTLRKKVEHLWKTRVLQYDKGGLSAVNETAYGNRFLKFLDKIIE